MIIKNQIDFSATKTQEPVKHHAALPSCIRRTQLLLNLITRWMKWDKIYLVAPSVDDQRCYKVLKDFNEKAKSEIDEDIFKFIADIKEAPSVDSPDRSIDNLVEYNYMMLDEHANPAWIFSRCIHKIMM